jgi:phosphoglycerol transferase MdoB-like AlkP superfamily enzyme
MKLTWLLPTGYRPRLWATLCLLLFAISFVTRIVLLVKSHAQVDFTFLNMAGIFLIGLFFDAVNAIYFSLPFVLYLWLAPERLFFKKWHSHIISGWLFILTAVLIFNGVAEYFFWDEFNSRFNFIAVDYLVYTTEVIGNINESYPMTWIILSIGVAAVLVAVLVAPRIKGDGMPFPFWQRTKLTMLYATVFALCYFGIFTRLHRFSENAYVNELAGNGMYELFAAYLNNELNYDQFYKGMNDDEAFRMVHAMISTPDVVWPFGDVTGIERRIVNPGREKRMNVVLISIESFSAEFMGLFGNKTRITPFMDSLAQHSLAFTNLYATGTRTVRGLEALSLCVPPTPGQSIVRRPENEHLFSLGKVFHDKGYRCEYIYGGYGYFDNMGYFFGNNTYEVVDRTSLDDREVHYENIWGVADEDLFTLAGRQLDEGTARHPVFAHVMTTSNHRPFTYPDGRIDIPSHTGRDGAVKYTDYAIGKFIKESKGKKWFKNTIFVIVADHCASSAGKTDLPVNRYHIPMLIYSPGNVEQGTMARLMSQIDIGPTLLGMLNFSYDTKFFGYDMFRLEPGRERAFISTYQNLGYMKNGQLVILSPRRQSSVFELSGNLEPVSQVDDRKLVREAIAWYQSASHSFTRGLMKETPVKTAVHEDTDH